MKCKRAVRIKLDCYVTHNAPEVDTSKIPATVGSDESDYSETEAVEKTSLLWMHYFKNECLSSYSTLCSCSKLTTLQISYTSF